MKTIVLASGSASRRAMLEAAGLDIVVDPPDLDEAVVKDECSAHGHGTRKTAAILAARKAARVAGRHPGSFVLAADQMLECDGEWFDKPVDLEAAAWQIARLAGRAHRLVTSAVVVRDRKTLWRTTTTATLVMRPLGGPFIEHYLDRVGERALASVGGYQIEGLGVQLFSKVKGDHFTIQGLPLLPLLAFLREKGVIPV